MSCLKPSKIWAQTSSARCVSVDPSLLSYLSARSIPSRSPPSLRPRLVQAPRLDALKLLADQHAQLTILRNWIATTATTVARGKTGRDASNVRALVRRVNEIIETHTGKSLGKGKRKFHFTLELCKLAEPQIKSGSVTAAIEALNSEKLASENSINLG